MGNWPLTGLGNLNHSGDCVQRFKFQTYRRHGRVFDAHAFLSICSMNILKAKNMTLSLRIKYAPLYMNCSAGGIQNGNETVFKMCLHACKKNNIKSQKSGGSTASKYRFPRHLQTFSLSSIVVSLAKRKSIQLSGFLSDKSEMIQLFSQEVTKRTFIQCVAYFPFLEKLATRRTLKLHEK